MKTYIKNTIILCALSFSFTACDLDLRPTGETSGEDFWKTESDAWYGLNTCYAGLKGLDVWDELATDNGHSHKPWEGAFELLQQNGISTANPYGSYSFTNIRAANLFLKNADNCAMDNELRERMKAEARFFRAFSYLDLTLYYGKVAIVEDVLEYDAPNVARNSVEEARKFILDELLAITSILPAEYNGKYLYESGRITKYAAWALRARAALYFGDFVEAERSALQVIESNKYSLFKLNELSDSHKQEAAEMDLYVDFNSLGIDKDKFIKGMFSYEALWHNENADVSNPEYVLTREYAAEANNSDMYRYTFFIPFQMSTYHGYSSYEPMQDMVDAYWMTDGKSIPKQISVDTRAQNYAKLWDDTKDLDPDEYKAFVTGSKLMSYDYMQEFKNRDSRLYVTLMFPAKGWHGSAKGEMYYKWNPEVISRNGNESWTGFSYRKMVSIKPYDRTKSSDDYPVIRYAEVLLTYAEARLMNSGYDANVQKELNKLRERCGMANVPTDLTKEAAIDFLRNERRIELAVEGHRYDDVRRYGSEYCKKYLNGPSTAPNGYVIVNKKWDDRLMLMPLPTKAMDNNPLLKEDQNPGY